MSILADCLFFLCSGLVLMFVAHFMKEWEARAHRKMVVLDDIDRLYRAILVDVIEDRLLNGIPGDGKPLSGSNWAILADKRRIIIEGPEK